MLAGLSPARRRLVVTVLALVVVAVLVTGATLLLGRLSGAAGREPVSQSEPGPVLLVPGYGGSTASLQPLADRLAAEGRDATVVAVPGNGTGDLGGSADVLDEAVDAALERTGANSVDVVGYSAGGVVARLWAADGGADVARRIVTLGSPHHGTTLADLAGSLSPDQCPEACRQLATGSPLLIHLNAGDETPEGPAWVSIWTTQDETVTPPESARLEGALELPVQSVCADARVAHGDLPRHPLVQAMVLEQLGVAAPAALGPEDCARLSG
ncbi:lipase family alpha/beta hydrolase [Geodermatophilus obscurus]|uniref:Lipase class 2 n=1 Tax=Geodermatophilus obscurus (strain ATCC 25078 / DSM 43160 / JCM 3152 / CCUG 61914 / KCC A-0152 / KCTC 9177 / NBRC 13315 / NRRL B-3577 / G-20) TaxID=526225 RepID=D2SA86_GEOOG|nr:alpha/beta fold hydrolase [Geodermatophilus obscurus]ADB75901.1 lipase class 2 [Geodermatophilus obscurus DSM 43160]